jgi:type I restriction enzyme, S subunit
MSELPIGWTTAKLPDVFGRGGLMNDGDWVESKDQDPNGEVRLIQLADVGEFKFLDKSSRFLTGDKLVELRCTELQDGDVLIARMPDPLGRACVYPSFPNRGVTVVDVCIWRKGEEGADPSWVATMLNAPQSRGWIAGHASGTTRKRISSGNLKKYEFPLPPLAEQKRIVEKLDSLTTASTEARTALTRVETLVEQYRAALIEHALSGRLTKNWRDQHSSNTEAWRQSEIGIEAEIVTGNTPPTKHPQYYGGRYPFVKPGDMDLDKPTMSAENSLSEEGFQAARQLPANAVLVSCIGNLGKVALLGVDGSCNQQINAILPSPALVPEFVFYWAKSISKWLYANSSATTVSIINKRRFSRAPINVPPKAEQLEIVRQIEGAFAQIDMLASAAKSARERLDKLDRAVLAKAFRGELVPQDPNDEPASELLKRLQKEPA